MLDCRVSVLKTRNGSQQDLSVAVTIKIGCTGNGLKVKEKKMKIVTNRI